jgi:hypothetical protein
MTVMALPSATYAQRAPRGVHDADPVRALHRRLEFYPTPPWAARAIGRFVADLDPPARTVWEPACGEGHMAAALAETFDVRASDIHAHGYGEVVDFLDPHRIGRDADWIITNPPFDGEFGTAKAFARMALSRARRGVALLCRSAFEESVGRHGLFHGARPATMKVVFAERVPMVLGEYRPRASTAMSYSLFVWCKRPLADQFPGAPLWRSFPPGTRARFERPDDVRWAASGPRPSGEFWGPLARPARGNT